MPYIVNTVQALDLSSKEPIKSMGYKMNDLSSVFSHYDKTTGKNVQTENKIKSSKEDNK